MGRSSVAVGFALALTAAGCGSGGGAGLDGGAPGGIDADRSAEVPDGLTCLPTSGTRLRRSIRTHDDGTTVDVGIHDLIRGAACVLEPTTDGTFRCVPTEGVFQALPRYADPACQELLVEVLPGAVEPTPGAIGRVVHDDGDPCTNEAAFYAFGARRDGTNGELVVHARDAAGCAPVAAIGPVFEVGVADLVAAEVRWVGGELAMRQLDAEDGSRWCDVFGPIDHDGRPCSLGFGDDQRIRCLPPARTSIEVFADAACSTPTRIVLPAGICERGVELARGASPSTCVGSPLHAIGAALTAPIYEGAGDACTLSVWSEPTPDVLGAVVPATTFPEVVRSYTALGGRLERGDLAGPGLRLFRTQLRDADLDVACAFEPATDGTSRCLPNATSARDDVVARVQVGFADAACTVTRSVASIETGCSTATPRYARPAEGGTVFAVGAATSAPLYVLGETCVPLTGNDHYELGAELAPATFVAGTESIE